MGYSRSDIIRKCRDAFDDVKTFYKQPFINYNGRTEDTKEYDTEVVAEFLCDHISAFVEGIPQITRETTYRTEGHTGVFEKDSPREEEKIAMEMFVQSQKGLRYDLVGDMIDYQTPLKNKRSDEAGKIDLLSYDGKTLHILELKKSDSEESMLRCVLEGFTYMQTVNKAKLLDDFCLPSDTVVKASPFVFKNKLQHMQMQEKRPHLLRLMQYLDSKPYYITKENNRYKVGE